MLTGYKNRPAAPVPTPASRERSIAVAMALGFRPIPFNGLRYIPLITPRRDK